jgi:hypothetical protein
LPLGILWFGTPVAFSTPDLTDTKELPDKLTATGRSPDGPAVSPDRGALAIG